MTMKIIQRKRIFIAGEGESEQSLVKWFQQLLNQKSLAIHLDCQPLGGGGYKTMLSKAVRERKRKERHKAKYSILLVDGDRAIRGDDGWSIPQLKHEATKQKITVCVQNPNHEGLLLRMFPGNERLQPSIASIKSQLRSVWLDYQKPADARELELKFTHDDLRRVAQQDDDISNLLKMIGLKLKEE
jgi:hypothetical protein